MQAAQSVVRVEDMAAVGEEKATEAAGVAAGAAGELESFDPVESLRHPDHHLFR